MQVLVFCISTIVMCWRIHSFEGLSLCINLLLFVFQQMKTHPTKEEECPKRNSVQLFLLQGMCGSACEAWVCPAASVWLTVMECCCEQTAVCISIRKNKCNNILSYTVCLLPFLRWRPPRRRHSLSCTSHLCLTTAPSFVEAMLKTTKTPTLMMKVLSSVHLGSLFPELCL